MNQIKNIAAISILVLAFAALVACSQQPTPQPVAPDTPIPAPTAAAAPSSAPLAEIPTQAPATPIPAPTIPVMSNIQASSPMPTPTQVVFVMPPPAPTEVPTEVTTPEPTATEVVTVQVVPTEESTREPTPKPTLVSIPEPTPTEVPPTPVPPTSTPEPTPEPTPTEVPQDTSPPYVIAADFFAGNTLSNPGPENCNLDRCGGARIIFSEAVLTHGNPVMDILTKGIIECIEGCSDTNPSSYIILSGTAWIEPGDVIAGSRILMDGGGSITDASGNELDTYMLGTEVKARASDFAMVQGPTPVPTPVPSSVSNQWPYAIYVYYKDTTVELHINEPVVVTANSPSDVGINVRLKDGTVVNGECIAPCEGDTAMLSFNVPELSPSAVATSINLVNGATIRDSEGLDIDAEFEELTLGQIVTIEKIEVIPLDFSNFGMQHLYWTVNFFFTGLVWIDGTEIKLRTASGLEIPCYDCFYGPKAQYDFMEFGWPIDDLSVIPEVPDDDSVIEMLVNGNLISMSGIMTDLQFNPVPFKH